MEDSKCNLGWRIVSKNIYNKNGREGEFKKVLEASNADTTKPFLELLDKETRKYIKNIRALLNKLNDGTEIPEEDMMMVFECLGYDVIEIAGNKLKGELNSNFIQKNIYKNTKIKITTILGSKGLTFDYSFLINFDDRFLLGKEGVTDENICKFFVALTRTKDRTYIYTGSNDIPYFVKWIDSGLYEEI